MSHVQSNDEHASNATTLVDILSSSALPLSSSSSTYLHHLTTLPLSSLLSEPPRLTTQSHHLTSSLTSLTHSSYPTFLALHRTTTALSGSLTSLSNSLSSLLTSSFPALESTSSSFKQTTDPILAERSKARLVLDQHDKLRDLLDIPVLLDTCVRNGYFAEALSLASHTASLNPDAAPSIINSIQLEVATSIGSMLRTLLLTLHEPNKKLPGLWKAVNFLRRMEVLDDEELALAFLTGRGECLARTFDSLGSPTFGSKAEMDDREREDIARYLKKYIDVWREGVYDIITQYSTIFLERSPSTTNPTSPTRPALSSSPSPQLTAPHSTLRSLLTTYTSHTLPTLLLPTLTTLLPHLPPSALASILTQLTYCASAFARVGFDFRGVLGGLFEDAVWRSASAGIRDAGRAWSKKLDSNGKKKVSKWIITSNAVTSPPLPPRIITTQPPNIPPQIISSYPPLAEFTNALLGTFNNLRSLAPVAIMDALLHELESVLEDGAKGLLVLAKEVVEAQDYEVGRDGEKEKQEVKRLFKACGEVYMKVFLPFVRRALLEGVYGVEDGGAVASGLQGVIRKWEGWLDEMEV